MSKIACASVAGAVVCLLSGFGALAEDPGAGGGAVGGGAGGRPTDLSASKQKKLDKKFDLVKETLGVTDEEWKVLEPKVEAVRSLSKQGRLTISGKKKKGAADDPNQPQIDLEQKILELRKLAAIKDTDTRTLRDKLKEYRDTREKCNADLKKARNELRELLTPRQEVQMVLMGLLD